MKFANRPLHCIALATVVAATGLRDTIAEQTDLSIFKDLVDQYDVWQPFSQMENITVLAPNNAAYELLSQIGLNLSEMGADFTVPILRYHFLEGIYNSKSFADGPHATLVHTALTGLNMSQSAPVKLSQVGNDRIAEGGLQLSASVVKADIAFDGGLIHTLNSTLVAPHNISATAFMNQLFEFLEILETSDMVGTLESLHDATIFIPNDAAWMKYKNLLGLMSSKQAAKVLEYHAVKSDVLYQQTISPTEQTYATIEGSSISLKTDETGNILVNGLRVIKENLVWYGGVAHIIEDVLVPATSDETRQGSYGCSAYVHFGSALFTHAKRRPVVTTTSAFFAALVLCMSIFALIHRYRSRKAAKWMGKAQQEQHILAEKLLA